MTKALLVRGHLLATRNTDYVFRLFEDADVNWDAARAIGAIVATDKVLTKRNHAVIKVGLKTAYDSAQNPAISSRFYMLSGIVAPFFRGSYLERSHPQVCSV